MSPSQSSLLLLLLVSGSWASHFYGGTMTFDPRGRNPNGTYRVDLRHKTGFHSCTDTDTWLCVSGDCGTRTSLAVQTVDREISGDWCQTEGRMTRHVSNNTHTFDLRMDGGNWISTTNNVVGWRLLTHVDLGVRSDTGKVNRSPQTTVIPLMRVPVNCRRDFNMLSFDPDGDAVRCRYAVPTDECVTSSNLAGVNFTLRWDCTLSFWSNTNTTGTYAVQMMMEDFPTQSISLSYTNGSQSNRTSGQTLSKLPVQFAMTVDPVVPSCTEGVYIPMFLSPTPAQGALLYASADHPLEISVRAQATHSTVSELLMSGPGNIRENTTSPGEHLLRWTPTDDEEGGYYPVCFIAQGVLGSSRYQSELRCVIVSVNSSAITTTPITATFPTTTQPTSDFTTFSTNPTTDLTTNNVDNTTMSNGPRYVVGLGMKLSSLTSLTDDHIRETVLQKLREELIRRGLSGDVTLRLRASQEISP
ncbi:uncharacterized protein ACWYII_015031 [Salvelinus alpinus]